jgi:HEAT repeat protein
MANRARNLWTVVVLALLGGFAWVVLRPHEPVFEGKPLSVVLNEANRNWALAQGQFTGLYPPGSEIPRMRAERALRALGTNALPILVKMAGTRMSLFRKIVGSMARESNMDFLHLPPQEDKHEIAAWGMRLLGKEARLAVPALIRFLSDRDPEVQWAAADCLAGIGPEAAVAVPALVRMLKNRNRAKQYDATVYWAARALGEIGPAAGAAIPSLEEVTNNAALASAHAVAAVALIKIGQGSFQPFFERLKDTSDQGKWSRTAHEVERLGTNADPAIPFLLAAFQHTNDNIRARAVSLVGEVHRRPDLCLRPLVSLLNATNSRVRWQTLEALGKFGPAAKPVAPEVARCLTDPDARVRIAAATALRLIDPEARGLKAK